MTNEGDDFVGESDFEVDPAEAAWLGAMLTDLADDPAAPPSTVSPLSVIAAAKRSGGTAESGGDPVDIRSRRRRRALTALVAAACVAAVAAVVVPITLQRNTSGTSAATADRAEVAASASSPAGMALSTQAPEPELAPSVAGSVAAGEVAPGASPEVAADSGLTAESAAASATGGCAPLLTEASMAALLASLPDGFVGSMDPPAGDCGPDTVAGADLVDTASGAAVRVRVTLAAPGVCVVTGCIADDGGYTGTDSNGNVVAYRYGNGYQVAVGGADGPIPADSGLTAAQLSQAAQAVLSTLG